MANKLNKVKHIVVLMLENRSFDHLLGYLKANGIKPAVDGLTGTETNPTIPPATGPVMVTAAAGDAEPKPDSGHELADVSEQYYGHVDLAFPPNGPMNGFVANYAKQPTPPPSGAPIMKCVDPAKIPALVELAKQFCVCDRWHASVPGSTWPNRMFAHAATSAGTVTNVLNLYIQPTIFDRLALAMMLSVARRQTANPRVAALSTLQRSLVWLADQIRIPGEDRSRVTALERIRTEQQGGSSWKLGSPR
jgi:phospholipase C